MLLDEVINILTKKEKKKQKKKEIIIIVSTFFRTRQASSLITHYSLLSYLSFAPPLAGRHSLRLKTFCGN